MDAHLELLEMIGFTETTRKAILLDGRKVGEVKCPKCQQGTVHFAIAPNGHVRARCTTVDCLAWIE